MKRSSDPHRAVATAAAAGPDIPGGRAQHDDRQRRAAHHLTQFQASAEQLAWIVNATPMVSAAFILFAGAWSDRIGRKRMLIIGNVIFLVSAILSGMTDSVQILILLRALTGLGSAMAMPRRWR